MKLIVRADDLGFSKAYNQGYIEAIRNGIVTSAELMIGMPGTEDGAELIKEFPWIPIGWHNHMCGKATADPSLIPHLIDAEGNLNIRENRNVRDDVNADELYIEMKAEVERFIQLVGRKPDIIANVSDRLAAYEVLKRRICEEYKINYYKNGDTYGVWFFEDGDYHLREFPSVALRNGRERKPWPSTQIQQDEYRPEDILLTMNDDLYEQDIVGTVVFHPGYVDDYILKNSTLTVGRCRDVACCTNVEVMEYLKKQQVELITCNDYFYHTNDYQKFSCTR